MSDKSGAIAFKNLIWLLILAALIYGAYKFVPPYFTYHMLKTDVYQEAQNAHMYTDEALAKRIREKAAVWSIELGKENLDISRGDSSIRITVNYSYELDFLTLYKTVFDYNIDVEEPIKARMN